MQWSERALLGCLALCAAVAAAPPPGPAAEPNPENILSRHDSVAAVVLAGLPLPPPGVAREFGIAPVEASVAAGSRYLREGDWAGAVGVFEAVTWEEPRNVEAHYLLGVSLEMARRPWDAVGAYRSAARLNPGHVDALYRLGVAYGRLSCFQDAAESFERVVELSPDDFDAYFKLGYAYSRLGWEEEARHAFMRAIAYGCEQLTPADETCSLRAQQRFDRMMETYQQHVWSGSNEADIHYQRGLTYLILARLDLAMGEYRSLKQVDPLRAARLYRMIRH